MKKYKKYKNSKIDWIGEIPEYWEVEKLKWLFYEKKKETDPSLPSGAISFGEVVYKDDEKVTEATKATYQIVNKGEYLVNPLNLNYDLKSLRIALSHIDVVVSTGYIVLKNKTKISKSYYKWLLHIYDIRYMKTLGSGVRQTISFNHISESLLPFPPLPEQTAIANFLDEKTSKIEEAVHIKEREIELLKERRQIIIQEVVTGKKVYDETQDAWVKPQKTKDSGVEWIGEIPEDWEVRKLKYCLKSKLKYGANESGVDYDENLPRYIRITDFAFGGKLSEDNKLSLTWEQGGNYLLKDGDILFARSGATVGKSYQFRKDMSKEKFYAFAGYLIKAEPNENMIFSDFLYSYTNSPLFDRWKESIFNKATIENIGANKYEHLPVLMPNLNSQKKIISYLSIIESKISHSITLKQQEIEKLKEYKTVLIDAAVTGKIRVSEVKKMEEYAN